MIAIPPYIIASPLGIYLSGGCGGSGNVERAASTRNALFVLLAAFGAYAMRQMLIRESYRLRCNYTVRIIVVCDGCV